MEVIKHKKIDIILNKEDVEKMKEIVEYLDDFYEIIGDKGDELTIDGWSVDREKLAKAIFYCSTELESLYEG